MAAYTHIDIRMYNTGTGDCFVLKFRKDNEVVFRMMIDGGTWSGSKAKLTKYVKDLKAFVDNQLDVLVITHEHKDHVHLFNACKDQFTNDFAVGEIWMAWTEDKRDSLARRWKKAHGKKKMALASASKRIEGELADIKSNSDESKDFHAKEIFESFKTFSASLNGFNQLHSALDDNKKYIGGLAGMKVIKEKIADKNIRYFKPGQIESNPNLPGVNFYVLGPPRSIRAVEKEHGKKHGDTYDHNKVLRRSDSFAAAVSGEGDEMGESPFESKYHDKGTNASIDYKNPKQNWRSIDLDWLMAGAGSLALRLTSGINNLSLVLAIEIEASKQVLLFPGDAEFGSWESWHKIDWSESTDRIRTTEDLLKKTVFYKVAHHLSHNGTAKDKGLKMMTSNDLTSMATLDFEVISPHWKSTMPNRGILEDLIKQTKGRLIVMNDKGMFYDFEGKQPLKDKIEDARNDMTAKEKRAFDEAYEKHRLYHQYTIKV